MPSYPPFKESTESKIASVLKELDARGIPTLEFLGMVGFYSTESFTVVELEQMNLSIDVLLNKYRFDLSRSIESWEKNGRKFYRQLTHYEADWPILQSLVLSISNISSGSILCGGRAYSAITEQLKQYIGAAENIRGITTWAAFDILVGSKINEDHILIPGYPPIILRVAIVERKPEPPPFTRSRTNHSITGQRHVEIKED